MTITERIHQEKEKAKHKYGNFNSTHEAYAVLKEEVEEFWEIIRGINYNYCLGEKSNSMIAELIQVAAVAQRTAEELEKGEIKWI